VREHRIEIERIRPERGPRGAAAAPAGQCCCCCCCLHSLGGLIGALTATAKPVPAEQVPTATTDKPQLAPKHSATGLYWTIVLIVSGLFVSYNFAVERHPDDGESLLIIALALPVIQLFASFLVVIVIGFSTRPGRDIRIAHLGRITLRAFLGALIGVVIMLPLLGKL
jgi:hypothetical protein